MRLRIFAKIILTLSFWIPASKACILCQATKRNAFIFYSERIFIMNTTKNWVMRHLPYIGTAVLLCGCTGLSAWKLLSAAHQLCASACRSPAVPWGRDSFPEKQILQINTKPLSVCILIPRGVPFFLIFCFLPPDDKSASRERKISPHIPSWYCPHNRCYVNPGWYWKASSHPRRIHSARIQTDRGYPS